MWPPKLLNCFHTLKTWDSDNWKWEIDGNTSLNTHMTNGKICDTWKGTIKEEEDLYVNRPASEIMYRARR